MYTMQADPYNTLHPTPDIYWQAVPTSRSFGPPEATLVKTKLNGALVWEAVYGQAKSDIFNSVRDIPGTANLKAGYAALGSSQSFGLGGDDVYFVRTDATGVPVFSYIYGRSKDDRGNCLQYIKDPTVGTGYGYVMAGETSSFPQFPGLTSTSLRPTSSAPLYAPP